MQESILKFVRSVRHWAGQVFTPRGESVGMTTSHIGTAEPILGVIASASAFALLVVMVVSTTSSPSQGSVKSAQEPAQSRVVKKPVASPTPGLPASLVSQTSRPKRPSDWKSNQFVGPTLSKGRPVIYLTIDDGPSKYTPQILDILREHGFTATFFEVGENVVTYPNYVQDVLNQGSVIGNHTWDHPQLTKISNRAIAWQLSRTTAALRAAGAPTPTCTRPPYGATSTRVHSVITGQAQSQVLWSVDPRDWARPGVRSIVSTVERNAVPGSVVLIHDGGGERSQTVAATRQIADWVVRRGWTIQALPVCGQFD